MQNQYQMIWNYMSDKGKGKGLAKGKGWKPGSGPYGKGHKGDGKGFKGGGKGRGGGKGSCFNCNQLGHVARNCPQTQTKRKGKGTGHKAVDWLQGKEMNNIGEAGTEPDFGCS